MTNYIVLHTTDGTITGENVSELTALNNNYDTIDTQLKGFQAYNAAGGPVTLANAEVGMCVYPSYHTDKGGATLYVSNGAGTWHASDQKEVFGSWTRLVVTNNTEFNAAGSTLSYRLSNFGRVEWMMAINYQSAVPANKGTWQMLHDPSATVLGNRIPYLTYGPHNPSVYPGGPYVFEGVFQPNTSGSGGYGEQIRIAIDMVTVSSVDSVRIRACYTDIASGSSGVNTAFAGTVYDAGSGYGGPA